MSTSKLKVGVAVVGVVGVVVLLVVQHQTIADLRAQKAALQQETARVADLEAENQRLTQAQASADDPGRQQNELVRLRGEVTRLRQQRDEATRLAAENARLRDALSSAGAGRNNQGPPASDPAAVAFRNETMARMNTGKQAAVAFLMFANDHQDALPGSVDLLEDYLSKQSEVMAALRTNFDLLSSGALASLTNPAKTILLREKIARQGPDGRWTQVYVFADGHSEAPTSPTGDFAQFEKDRALITTGR